MPKKKSVETPLEDFQEGKADETIIQEETPPPADLEQTADAAMEEGVITEDEPPEILAIEPLPDEEKDAASITEKPVTPERVPQGGVSFPPEKVLSPAERQRREFYATDFWGVDKGLSPQQRQEWSAIYASYRGQSVLRGLVVGVDPMMMWAKDRRTGEHIELATFGVTISSCCARIIIPQEEMWFSEDERPDFALRNLYGATLDFVVTQVDRDGSFVVASRRKALKARRRHFTRSSLNREGARTECDLLITGPNSCTVTCHGYDILLSQRELSYPAVPDLRQAFRDKKNPLPCIVKGFNAETGQLMISVKEAGPNPFDGAEFRHPLGSRRQGKIAGKYGGGVFVTLPDDVTVMCNYAFQYEDTDFELEDQVLVIINRYSYEKKQIYGKIIAKF